jgi:CMP-N,N'-diacetyllegionaminic acid synthase
MDKKKINENFVVIIPLRKGSKRIKNKNFTLIKNKPLIYYTYREAIKVFDSENIFVSSNDPKAKKFSKKFKLQYIDRPKKICKDNSKTEDAIIHFLKQKKISAENIVLLQATSPMRTAKDIINGINKYNNKKLDSIFSVFKEKNFLWKKNNKKLYSISFDYKNRKRVQNMENIYHENGAVFIFNKKKFTKYKNRIFGKFDFFEMSKSNSIDIDYKEDLETFKNYIS